MKVIAFNGSPRKNGNTRRALEIVLEEIASEGIETEMIDIAAKGLEPCHACGACGRNKDRKCIYDKDKLNLWVEKICEADGFILGSPTYFGNMSPQTKAFIDRVGYVSRANGFLLKRKVGAAVAVNRRAGALVTFQNINNLFLISQMIVPASSYWNVVTAMNPGDIDNDAEGIKTMRTLGENVAWLVKKLNE
ncbi:MAG: flavodoxin family protein [Methanomassiliicoccales archaeon]|jgi:multimeric flavodoxin WrbA